MQFIVKMSGIGYTMIKEIFQGGGRIMDISERQQIVEHYAERRILWKYCEAEDFLQK